VFAFYYLRSRNPESSDADMFNDDVHLGNQVIGNLAPGSRSLFPSLTTHLLMLVLVFCRFFWAFQLWLEAARGLIFW
jgi:hypothetical protein